MRRNANAPGQLTFDDVFTQPVRAPVPRPDPANPDPADAVNYEGWRILERPDYGGVCRVNLRLAHGATEEICRLRLEAIPFDPLPGQVLVGLVVLPWGVSPRSTDF